MGRASIPGCDKTFPSELIIHWGSFAGALFLVLWQIYAGAEKFFSNPIATKTFTEDIIAPFITVCHDFPQFGYSLDQFGIGLADYEQEGQCSTQRDSAEDVFRSATEQFYFVLDGSGEILYHSLGLVLVRLFLDLSQVLKL